MNCKECKKEIEQYTNLRKICIGCAIIEVKEKERVKREKVFNKETRTLKAKFKKKSDWLPEVQTAFNRFIRARDRYFYLRQGKLPECISCGNNNPEIQYCAGHFKTRGGFPELRFTETNCHLQCNKNCNMELSGNIEGTKTTRGYKKGIVVKFGELEAVKILAELNSYHETQNWTCGELEQMKKDFNYRANALEKLIENI